MICVLAGGVGAARFLRGLVQVVPAHDITAIVNTGDDTVLGLQLRCFTVLRLRFKGISKAENGFFGIRSAEKRYSGWHSVRAKPHRNNN